MKKSPEKLVCALIAAAGNGSRMKIDKNKQYLEIDGKPVLARTIQVFEDCESIDEIVIVVSYDNIVQCKKEIVDVYGFSKVKLIASGGETRQKSVYNGLLQVNPACSIILIHDGARPFVSRDSIINSIKAANEYGGACVAVPVKDTIKRAGADGFIEKTIDRNSLWSIQTPQTFRYSLIMDAYERAEQEGFEATDDAMVLERIGHRVKIVDGSYYNIKITTFEDIQIANAIALGNY